MVNGGRQPPIRCLPNVLVMQHSKMKQLEKHIKQIHDVSSGLYYFWEMPKKKLHYYIIIVR